jgi:hypothetical protein
LVIARLALGLVAWAAYLWRQLGWIGTESGACGYDG